MFGIIDRRVFLGNLVGLLPAHSAAVVVIVVVVRRCVSHLSNWVMHLLGRRSSISGWHLLIRIPVNASRVIERLMMVAMSRVVELVDNVLLGTRVTVVVVAASVITLGDTATGATICSIHGVAACHELCGGPLGRAVLLTSAALHHFMLWHNRGSCLVWHATVPTESRLVRLHLFNHV